MYDELFLLINSLSKQEKRYFKIFSSTYRKSTNYIKLFEALSKQKTYNKEDIIRQFKNEKFIQQLHVTKNYLYNLILKSLHLYHINASANSKIKKLLHYVEILYKKGLYGQCKKVLLKAKKLAVLHKLHLPLIEIIEWQSKIAFISANVKDLHNYVNIGYDEENKIIENLKNENFFRNLFYKILILNNKGTPVRNEPELLLYNNIIKTSLLKNAKNAKTYYSKLMLNYIYAYYFLNLGDIENSNKYNKKNVEIIESDSILIKETPIVYVSALNNTAYASIQLNEFENSKNAIIKLREIPAKYSLSKDLENDLEKKIFIRSYYLELEMYKTMGDFNKSIQIINKIHTRIISLNKRDISRYTLFLYYTISYIFFAVKEYSKALYWINKLLNNTKHAEPVDLFCFARILNLLIHYELNNYSLTEYLCNSNIRFFKKKNRLYELEKLIFDFIKNKLLKETSANNLIKDFKRLKDAILKTFITPYNKKAIQYFDYISWIDSKIKNISFADALKK